MLCLQGLRELRPNGRRRVAIKAAIAVTVGMAIATALPGTAPIPAYAQDVSRGAALLEEARTAIGGEQRLASVRTLEVTGTFRRVVGGNDTEGDFEVFIELPDRYLRSEKTGTPGQPSTETIEALLGNEVRDAVRGGGSRDGRAAGGDGFPPEDFGGDPDALGRDEAPDAAFGDPQLAEADVAPGPPAGPGSGRGGDLVPNPDAQRQARQADVSRLLLMWLLRSETPLAWVGIAESLEGKADVLETRYADGQPTRLFVESSTHLPLMMQWEAESARGGGGRGRRSGGRRSGGGQRGGAQDGAGPRRGGPPPIVTFEMTFFDHRTVDGIRLPYVITRGTNGQTTERWAVSRYRVNESIPADAFTR